MNKIEIETITEAMTTKQTWVRKSLDDFLRTWADLTQEDISGHTDFELYEYTDDNGAVKKLVLRRGIMAIYGYTQDVFFEHDWDEWDYYLNIETQPIARIRKIINCIHTGLNGYFKAIQKDIDINSQAGQKINELINKLS